MKLLNSPALAVVWLALLSQVEVRAALSGLLRMNIWMALVLAACGVRYGMSSMRYGFTLAVVSVLQTLLCLFFPSALFHFPGAMLYKPIPADTPDFRIAALSVQLGKPLFGIDQHQWDVLSSGTLRRSPHSEADVRFGIDLVKANGGLHIGMLARNVAGNMDAIKTNVKAMAMFLPSVTVTIFENDSTDGTRERFKQWRADTKKSPISVHLMECPGVVDCKLKRGHRYNSVGSSLQRMASYRTLVTDFISANVSKGHGWMLVTDSDLNANWSPLGFFAAVGKSPGNAIASRGIMLWPGTLGSMTVPYDFMAFEFRKSPTLVMLHSAFKALMTAGGLQLMGDVLSPFKLMLIRMMDYDGTPQRVVSAFNGLSVYPIPHIVRVGAKYTAGPSGYDCEHLSFSRYFNEIVLDPVWTTKLHPANPGGPTGYAVFLLYMQAMRKAVFYPCAAVTLGLFAVAHAAVHASNPFRLVKIIDASIRTSLQPRETEI